MGGTLMQRRRVWEDGPLDCKPLSSGTNMTVPEEEATANYVPAAAVIRRWQALSGITGWGQAEGIACADTAVYLWGADTVYCHELSGALRWSKALDTRPLAVLNASQPLLFTAGRVEVLSPPA